MSQRQAFALSVEKAVDPMQVQSLVSGRQAVPETMKSQLQALSLEDPACVFIARRINKLGFASSSQLRLYFSRYGEVKSVHVSHSRVKSVRPTGERRCPNVQWRLRAAALGFVVMCSREAIHHILEDGPEHEVNSVMVRVHPFHRRNVSQNEPEAESDPAAEGGEVMSLMNDSQFLQPVWSSLDMRFPCTEATQGGPDGYGLCKVLPLSPGLMYVSEQDLQDAMPAQYED